LSSEPLLSKGLEMYVPQAGEMQVHWTWVEPVYVLAPVLTFIKENMHQDAEALRESRASGEPKSPRAYTSFVRPPSHAASDQSLPNEGDALNNWWSNRFRPL
jgi:hypothetical protein